MVLCLNRMLKLNGIHPTLESAPGFSPNKIKDRIGLPSAKLFLPSRVKWRKEVVGGGSTVNVIFWILCFRFQRG